MSFKPASKATAFTTMCCDLRASTGRPFLPLHQVWGPFEQFSSWNGHSSKEIGRSKRNEFGSELVFSDVLAKVRKNIRTSSELLMSYLVRYFLFEDPALQMPTHKSLTTTKHPFFGILFVQLPGQNGPFFGRR